MNHKGKPTLDDLVLNFAISMLEDIVQRIENDKKTNDKTSNDKTGKQV